MLKGEKQGRYLFGEKLLSCPNGGLYGGQDLSLRRDVLLYRVTGDRKESDILFNLSHASVLTEPRFLHILDMGHDNLGPYAVLEKRPGQLLNQYLKSQSFSFWHAVELIYNLGKGMMEASEEKIRGFSVAADNLWYTDDKRLIVINYWSRGSSAQAGVKGLIHLLYELITSSMVVVGGFEKLEQSFRSVLKEHPDDAIDSILHLLKQTYMEQYSLSSFLIDIGVLLKNTTDIKKNTTAIHRNQDDIVKHKQVAEIKIKEDKIKEDKINEEDQVKEKVREKVNVKVEESIQDTLVSHEDDPSKSSKKKYILLACAALVLFVCMFSFVRHILLTPPESTGSTKATPAPQPNGVEISSKPAPTPPSDEPKTTTGDEVLVPNLQGLSQSDAEKQALAAGLHYQFFIEANSQAAGTVFRQDLPAGKKVSKDTKITFWVSKGNG